MPFRIVSKATGCVVGGWLWDIANNLTSPPFLKQMEWVADGTFVTPGTSVATGTASWSALLTWERTILNVMSYLSGIATETAACMKIMRAVNASVELSDTRKILPGFRDLAKHAVRCGGGTSHRRDLSSSVLIKENHVARLGDVVAVLRALRRSDRAETGWELEIDSLETLRLLLEDVNQHGCPTALSWVMLDNFSLEEVRMGIGALRACAQTQHLKVEISGGAERTSLAAWAACGPQRISMGALTHTVVPLDLSLLVTSPHV